MITRKSNEVVPMRLHKSFRRYLKIEAAKRGKSMLEYSREFGLQHEREETTKNGFKIGF